MSDRPREPGYAPDVTDHPPVADLRAAVATGGAERYHAANSAKGKLFARERIARLVDAGSFVEDGQLANVLAGDLPADGVITGAATIDGRPVCLMANDSTVKAGSWGARTVEKIIRIIERAYATGVPMVYLVDSAGARITDQVDLFPGRRGAGKIFWNQVRASGSIPQVCAVRAERGRRCVHPGVLRRRGDGRRQRLDVPGQRPHGRDGHRREDHPGGDGRRRMHCTESGVGHFLCPDEDAALLVVRRYLSYLPSNWEGTPPSAEAVAPRDIDLTALVPTSERQAFDMRRYVNGLVDEGSFFEIHALWAREVTVGFGRLDGEVVGVVGNNSMFKGGVLFVDSADKAARFIQLCDAFNVPLLFLADVPGFMVGTVGREAGHHPARRQDDHGGLRGDRAEDLRGGPQGLRRRAVRDGGPRLRARRHHRAAHREDRRDGRRGRGERGLRQQDRRDRRRGRAGRVRRRQRAEYDEDIDIVRLASELVVDAVVEPEELRGELIARFAAAAARTARSAAAVTASPRSDPARGGLGGCGFWWGVLFCVKGGGGGWFLMVMCEV